MIQTTPAQRYYLDAPTSYVVCSPSRDHITSVLNHSTGPKGVFWTNNSMISPIPNSPATSVLRNSHTHTTQHPSPIIITKMFLICEIRLVRDYAFETRLAAIRQNFRDIQVLAQESITRGKECKARRASKWNTLGWIVIRKRYYTHEELDFQRTHLVPLWEDMEARSSSVRAEIKRIKSEYSGQRKARLRIMSAAAYVIQKVAGWCLWNFERVQRNGKKVIEKRERKEWQAIQKRMRKERKVTEKQAKVSNKAR